ncbi:hypothetical protein EK21DRAFT_112060 [Setomelanomma holmii]|uniref:Uncharacterized protein n=1 Tax=Setomelanomma holmii TaxID=210430 RepID=A0A9P4H911_9PLEO|nr:hypothetical protein EK21DRAFT_112060 [Setomelanomma holmii]
MPLVIDNNQPGPSRYNPTTGRTSLFPLLNAMHSHALLRKSDERMYSYTPTSTTPATTSTNSTVPAFTPPSTSVNTSSPSYLSENIWTSDTTRSSALSWEPTPAWSDELDYLNRRDFYSVPSMAPAAISKALLADDTVSWEWKDIEAEWNVRESRVGSAAIEERGQNSEASSACGN